MGCWGRGAGVQVCAPEQLAWRSLVPWAARFMDELNALPRERGGVRETLRGWGNDLFPQNWPRWLKTW